MRLSLFFTEGVSLNTWATNGSLDREVAIYRGLQDSGWNIDFVTYGGSKDKKFAKRLGIPIRSNSLGLPESVYKSTLKLWPPSSSIFKSNQVGGADVALAASRRANAKFILRCGYLPSPFETLRYGENSHQAGAARLLERLIFPEADAVVVTTKLLAETVIEEHELQASKVNVIPNYVETDVFRPQNIKKKKFRIIYIGRFAYQKNLLALIEAVANLDLELVLVGGGDQADKLKEKAKGIRAQVTFLGNLPNHQLPTLLNEMSVFVLPSLLEGHPKALLEAMACGLAVIGTRVPGIQEIIRDGENGLLCEPDAASIRTAIRQLQSDSALREKLGTAASEYVNRNFSLEHILDLEVALLNSLVVA